jgi:hypothetical protein
MIIFILILILLAILYSSKRGRELLEGIFLLPFKIIGYPFKLAREAEEGRKRKEEEKLVENFKKSLSKEDLDLIQDKFILDVYFDNIREQINLYKKFKNGEIHKNYLKPEVLNNANGDNSLYIIKPEKIEQLRKS